MPLYLLLKTGKNEYSNPQVSVTHSTACTVAFGIQLATHTAKDLSLSRSETLHRTADISVNRGITGGKTLSYILTVSANHTLSVPDYETFLWGKGSTSANHAISSAVRYTGRKEVSVGHRATMVAGAHLDSGGIHVRATHSLSLTTHKTYGFVLPLSVIHDLDFSSLGEGNADVSVSVSHRAEVSDCQTQIRRINLRVHHVPTAAALDPCDSDPAITFSGIPLFFADEDTPDEEFMIYSDSEDLVDGRRRAYPGSQARLALELHCYCDGPGTIVGLEQTWGIPQTLYLRGRPFFNTYLTSLKKKRIEDSFWEYWVEFKQDNSLA